MSVFRYSVYVTVMCKKIKPAYVYLVSDMFRLAVVLLVFFNQSNLNI